MSGLRDGLYTLAAFHIFFVVPVFAFFLKKDFNDKNYRPRKLSWKIYGLLSFLFSCFLVLVLHIVVKTVGDMDWLMCYLVGFAWVLFLEYLYNCVKKLGFKKRNKDSE